MSDQKLTATQRDEITDKYDAGATQRELAAEYDVSIGLINKILSNALLPDCDNTSDDQDPDDIEIPSFHIRWEPWMAHAMCAQVDPDLWFPEKGGTTTEAKRICNTLCPVRTQCLNAALERGERFGVWGGHSERDRRTLTTTTQPGAAA